MGGIDIKIKDEYAVCVVLASEGYPKSYNKGEPIIGLGSLNDKLVFHAGTKKQGHNIVTNGGRVLNVVGVGNDLESAINNAYSIINKIDYSGKFYRKDIGLRGMQAIKKGA